MKAVVLSDTHKKHREVIMPPDTDIDCLIHCGDITSNGELDTIRDFSAWLKELPYKNKLIISGNHDGCFEVRDKTHAKSHKNRATAIQLLQDAGATYLEHEAMEINGLKVFGSPFSPFFFNWAFNVQRGEAMKEKWSKINSDTNLLITHGPPYGILDEVDGSFGVREKVGDQDLSNRIAELKELRVVVFGHVHRDNSEEPVIKDGVKYINASICNNRYQTTNKPIVFEI